MDNDLGNGWSAKRSATGAARPPRPAAAARPTSTSRCAAPSPGPTCGRSSPRLITRCGGPPPRRCGSTATGCPSGTRHADQPSSADLCEHGADVEDNRNAEADGCYQVTIDQNVDVRLLRCGDPVCDQADQLGAAGRREGTPRGRREVLVLPPSGYEQIDQVDIHQVGRRPHRPDSSLAGQGREIRQGAAEVLAGFC